MVRVPGERGYITWFYSIIYMWIRKVCRRHIFVKLLVHSIGVIGMVFGIFLLISTMPSITSLIGILIGLFRLILFITPMNLETM